MREKLFQWKLKRIEKRGERWKQEYELKESYAQYVPERKKRKVSNILLVVIVVVIMTYTAASFLLTYTTGMTIDSTLTTCFYTFWGSELVALATLKTTKIIKNYNKVEDSSDVSIQDDTCV
jgi:hypothetical protein